MKSLSIAIAIVLTLGAALFVIFHALGVGDKVAGPMASSALGFITFVHDKVDKSLSSGRSQVTPGIVPVSDFDIRWPYMLVYATMIFIGITEISGLLYSFPAAFVLRLTNGGASVTPELMVGVMAILALPLIGWSLFILGRWIGIRSARAGYWILPLALFVGRAIDLSLTYFTVKSSRPMLSGLQHNPAALVALAILIVILIGIGEVGVWRGNRVRFGAYFNSLLKQVSVTTRDTLLAITFEEARTASPSVVSTSAAVVVRS